MTTQLCADILGADFAAGNAWLAPLPEWRSRGTMVLHPHSPERPVTWQLPHDYDPQATCPKTPAWLHEAVGGAHDQVQVLRAYAKAVVTRRLAWGWPRPADAPQAHAGRCLTRRAPPALVDVRRPASTAGRPGARTACRAGGAPGSRAGGTARAVAPRPSGP